MVCVREALWQSDKDPRRLAKAIATRVPKMSVLWLAVLWSEGEDIYEILENALSPLAKTNLIMASWTGTIQSFLQVRYHNMTDRPDLVPRTWEFSTAYFAPLDTFKPFARAPPFGLTKLSNTGLEVRQHLLHIHIPLQWHSYWTSKTGERLLHSGPQHPQHLPYLELHMLQPTNAKEADDHEANPEIHRMDRYEHDRAEKASITATRNIFYWHKNNEEGLWLDDGTEDDIKRLRKLQSHPWINCDFGDDEDSGDEGKSEKNGLNEDGIRGWLAGVEQLPICSRAECENASDSRKDLGMNTN